METKKATCILTAVVISLLATNIVSAADKDKHEISYAIKNDISYRIADCNNLDKYAKEMCKLDIYYPENKKNFATVVWFHGGGLKSGNKHILEELKNQGISVIAVNYRLYPKVSCTVCIDDAAASVAWVFKNISQYGGDPNLIFVSGHSAGAYLALMLGLDKKYLAEYRIDADKIAGLIPFSGQTITHFSVREQKGIARTQPIVDEFAPLFHVRKDVCPITLITGDRNLELLGRYEENAYFVRMMKVAGHKKVELYEIQGYNHSDMQHPACHILLTHINNFTN